MKPKPIPSDKQRCCVLDCSSSRRETSHHFPKCEITGSKWVEAASNPRLLDLTYKQIYTNRYRICCLHFRDGDYQCGMRKKLKEGAIPSLMLPQRTESNFIVSKECGDQKIDANENENSTAAINLTPSTAEFSPVAFRNWIHKSAGSSSFRQSSLLEAAESSDSNFPSTPKSAKCEFLRTQLFSEKPEDIVNRAKVETSEKDNTVPEPSSCTSSHGELEGGNLVPGSSSENIKAGDANKKLEDTAKSLKSRPSKRLVWKREDLHEDTRTMYQHVLEAKKERDKYRTKSLRYAHRLRKISENVKAAEFSVHLDKLSTLQRHFVSMILRNVSKSKNGRRYTPDERLLCLSIYKRSVSAYRYLCTFLPIPSPKRVRQLLTKIRLDCGVTKTMKNCLKESADRMVDSLDRVCVLMWDEVSLKLNLTYCAEKDKIIGLEDWGTNRTSKYADHALVFLLRGIKTGWKIPITYNFCASQTTHGQLAICIKEVVRAVTKAGFVIAATVCDQGSSNMKAIKSMQADTDRIRQMKGIEKYWTIVIDDVEIVPLYDAPHLMKCIRNNLLTKDIEIDFNRPNLADNDRKFASWKHIITAYEVDVYASFLERNVPDLTEEHVYIEKMNKMRVKLMMQVFSKKMSRFIDVIARSGGAFETSIGNRTMPPEGIHTAFILHLMNGIGDGKNGVSHGDDHAKRIPWCENSYHEQFFSDAKRQLKSMRFVNTESHKPVKTDIPCLQNLIDTLQGFQLLWRKLKSLGFKSFETRNINQDPLENFFANVKSHDFRSNKPTCYQFEAIFKSLLITNLTSKHSPGYNCEEDSGAFILSECKSLIDGTDYLPHEVDDEEFVEEDEEDDLIGGDEAQDFNQNQIKNQTPEKTHIFSHSGDIIKSLQRSIPSIKSCSECLHGFGKQSSIRRESTCFRDMHLHAKRVLGKIFTTDISHVKLGLKSQRVLQRKLNLSFFTCGEHKREVFKFFKKICVAKYSQGVLTYINRVLRGRIVPKNTNRLSLPVKVAYQCYLKTVRKDKRPREMNEPTPKKATTKQLQANAAKIESENAKPIARQATGTAENVKPDTTKRKLEVENDNPDAKKKKV